MMQARIRAVAVLMLILASVALAANEQVVTGPLDYQPSQPRLTVDAALVGAAADAEALLAPVDGDYGPGAAFLEARYLNLGVGIEYPKGLGVSVGTTLFNYYEGSGYGSVLPVRVRVSWDLSSEPRWHNRSVYAFVTFHRTPRYDNIIYSGPPFQHEEFGVGASYTYYAVTPKVELGAEARDGQGVGPLLFLRVSLDLGGTYDLGRAHE